MREEIRNKPFLSHRDVVGLNFIREPGRYLFRRHYRTGLRSHIMEVLRPEDVEQETKGIVIDGLKRYPRARPLKMLRVFRTRFVSLNDALEEVSRVKMIETYLAPDHIARSDEFLVDYRTAQGKYELILCGLQEYVEGEVLEPWSPLDSNHLLSLLRQMGRGKAQDSGTPAEEWLMKVREKAENFVGKLKEMIADAHHVPDLAGVGNLLLTRSGEIRLVDINNISRVSLAPIVNLDDRGYPVCDKSIEALSLLEQKLVGSSLPGDDPVYLTFLAPERMREVRAVVRRFHRSMEPTIS